MSGNLMTRTTPPLFHGFSSTSGEDDTDDDRRRKSCSEKKKKQRHKRMKYGNTENKTPLKQRQYDSTRAPTPLQQTRPNSSLTTITTTTNKNSRKRRTTTPPTTRVKTSKQRRHNKNNKSRSSTSPNRQHRAARLPPLPQESDSATTSTRPMQTNTTTGTTEITSNVHLKRQAGDTTHSIRYEDECEYEQPLHETRKRKHDVCNSILAGQHRSSSPTNMNGEHRRSFRVESDAPFLALIEGMQMSGSIEPSLANSLPEGRQCHPRMGRMVELPCEAEVGTWTSQLRPKEDNKNATTNNHELPGSSSGSSGPPQGPHLVLRHESHTSIGPLRRYRSEHDASPRWNLAVSAIHPVLNRVSSADCQGTIADIDSSLIGSLSVVGFDGFTSTSDMNARAADVSAELLKHVEKNTPPLNQQQHRPFLLGIQGGIDHEYPIGVSFLCSLPLDINYQVWIAQDQNQANTPIVAVDIVIPRSSQDYSANPSTAIYSVQIDQEEREEDPFQLTEERLKKHTRKIAHEPFFDPLQRLWGNQHESQDLNQNQHGHNYNDTRIMDRQSEIVPIGLRLSTNKKAVEVDRGTTSPSKKEDHRQEKSSRDVVLVGSKKVVEKVWTAAMTDVIYLDRPITTTDTKRLACPPAPKKSVTTYVVGTADYKSSCEPQLMPTRVPAVETATKRMIIDEKKAPTTRRTAQESGTAMLKYHARNYQTVPIKSEDDHVKSKPTTRIQVTNEASDRVAPRVPRDISKATNTEKPPILVTPNVRQKLAREDSVEIGAELSLEGQAQDEAKEDSHQGMANKAETFTGKHQQVTTKVCNQREPHGSSTHVLDDAAGAFDPGPTPFSPLSLATSDTWHTAIMASDPPSHFGPVRKRRKCRFSQRYRRNGYPGHFGLALVTAATLLTWTASIPSQVPKTKILWKYEPQHSFFPNHGQEPAVEENLEPAKKNCWLCLYE